MNYKYTREFSNLACTCPPEDEQNEAGIVGYRWIHEDLAHPNNTLPPNIIAPNRSNPSQTCNKKCKGYALSFFKSAQKAENKLKRLVNGRPMFSERAGNSIAEIELESVDGTIGLPSNNSGHFNLHEFKDVDLQPRLKFIKKVIV